ncbi:MAG: HYR domain-containing protein [Saprospiraceae bacterium]|nr:HYR domain-containing protein [Saprospiraceae bacterium]
MGAALTAAVFNAGSIGVRLTQVSPTVDMDAIQMVVHYNLGNSDPDCSMASIPSQGANAMCQATISGADVSGITDPDMDPLTITVSPALLNLGMNSVTVNADDGMGGTCMTTINVNVTDNIPPTISCPSNVSVSNDPGQCGAVVNFPAPTASDNCDMSLTIVCTPASGSFFPVGMTMVTCTATDDTGNDSSCSFTVTVNDTEPPMITCPNGFTVECLAAIPACSGSDATVTDNCPGVGAPTCSQGMLVGDECMGTVKKTYEVMDAAGNMVSCTQTITIVAPQPVWNNPLGNLQLPCNVLPQPSTLSWTRGTGVCQTTGQVQSMIIGIVGLCEGSVTEHWEYTDVCGVTISHSRLVFYKIDTEALN